MSADVKGEMIPEGAATPPSKRLSLRRENVRTLGVRSAVRTGNQWNSLPPGTGGPPPSSCGETGVVTQSCSATYNGKI